MMRVTLVAPHYAPSTRGNSITVQRLRSGLIAAGADVEVLSPDGQVLAPCARPGAPTVVHGFHARQSGPAALDLAARKGSPCVITLTGTDFNEDLVHGSHGPLVRGVLDRATALVSFTKPSAGVLLERHPPAVQKLTIIPQAPFLQGWPEPRDLRPDGLFTVLHLGGIRPVKGNLFPVPPLERVHERQPRLRLVYAGPIIDRDYAELLLALIAARPWITYAGDVPHERVPDLLDAADVVLNTSLSEGGTCNSLLEAMWRGRPVLASAVAGNMQLVEPERTGLFFSTEQEFERQIERLFVESGLAERLGAAGREHVRNVYSPDQEIAAHLRLYLQLK